jgi:hypothetical protein
MLLVTRLMVLFSIPSQLINVLGGKGMWMMLSLLLDDTAAAAASFSYVLVLAFVSPRRV